ncbi:hypothetical protein [Actinomycetospora sp. TBRC 11914]|uniref:hypothetical protein n=1 Tax=Actinomycetospora sp. TBRC 11914 TaxID=2729387 RepID=UPI00145D887D|nr:hypothetical protein [Actinomycetospora sp. TBRC 11914]NMO89430.1 hypothetical protein [Actinomycetospora sp. TBRC 11914]
MAVELSEAQAGAVAVFLAGHLGDLSAEIAATENPSYRRELLERRELLRAALSALSRSPVPPEEAGGVPV